MSRFLNTAICIATLLLGGETGLAQDYPSRAVKAITNVSVGGTYDIFVRALADELQKRLGQPVVVEPRPGGNFMIAGRSCAQAAPDGHTICALSGETLYADLLNDNVPYEPQKAFEPVMSLFFNTQALVVNAALNVTTLDELADLARRKPKTLAYLAPGLVQRWFVERFNRQQGTDIVNVPFKGGGEALTSLFSGAVPVAFFGAANFASYVQSGKLIALAVDGDERSPLYPNTPTLTELGVKEKLPRAWLGLVMPAGTPRPIINRIHADVARIFADPDFRQRHLIDRGLEPVADSPDQFATFLKNDREVFVRFQREAGARP